MVYSSRLRAAVGDVRSTLEDLGIGVQSREFTEHGEHRASQEAPLVLVACSGGRDSMALAAVANLVCASIGVRCGAVIVDHGLQQDSAEVAAQAAQRCAALGLDPVEVRRLAVRRADRGIEAAARDARYSAIMGVAGGLEAAVVLLAHTENDQAETVLIDVMRSGGLDALAGMPADFMLGGVRFARPFLALTRAQTTGICRDLGISWWDDPTNGDDVAQTRVLPDGYPLRSRVRHTLVPFLEQFTGGDIVGHLAQSARLAGVEKRHLDQEAESASARAVEYRELGDSGAAALRIDAIHDEPQAIRLRVIAHMLSALGLQAGSRQVQAIDRLIVQWHGQAAVSLPSGYSAFRQKHVIRVCQDRTHANRGCEG